MAETFAVLYRGAASATSATLYTVPGATTTLVTTVVVTNTTASAQTFTLTFAGVDIMTDTSISANDSIVVDLKQLLDTGEVLAGDASSTSVNFHVTGLEIT